MQQNNDTICRNTSLHNKFARALEQSQVQRLNTRTKKNVHASGSYSSAGAACNKTMTQSVEICRSYREFLHMLKNLLNTEINRV